MIRFAIRSAFFFFLVDASWYRVAPLVNVIQKNGIEPVGEAVKNTKTRFLRLYRSISAKLFTWVGV